MTESDRAAYDELLKLIEGAGYQITQERFKSDKHDSEFRTTLYVVPPEDEDENENENERD